MHSWLYLPKLYFPPSRLIGPERCGILHGKIGSRGLPAIWGGQIRDALGENLGIIGAEGLGLRLSGKPHGKKALQSADNSVADPI